MGIGLLSDLDFDEIGNPDLRKITKSEKRVLEDRVTSSHFCNKFAKVNKMLD